MGSGPVSYTHLDVYKRQVQHDIQKNLGMVEAQVFKSSFNRPNLYYEVRPKTANVDKDIICLLYTSDADGVYAQLFYLIDVLAEEHTHALRTVSYTHLLFFSLFCLFSWGQQIFSGDYLYTCEVFFLSLLLALLLGYYIISYPYPVSYTHLAMRNTSVNTFLCITKEIPCYL